MTVLAWVATLEALALLVFIVLTNWHLDKIAALERDLRECRQDYAAALQQSCRMARLVMDRSSDDPI